MIPALAVLCCALTLAAVVFIAREIPPALEEHRRRKIAQDFAERHWKKKGIDLTPPWRRGAKALALVGLAFALSACSLQPRLDDSAKRMIREQALTAVKVRRDFLSGAALGDLQLKSRVNRLSAQIVAAETFAGEDIDGDGHVGEAK